MKDYFADYGKVGRCERGEQEAENWFTVFGDIDDFIFYQDHLLVDDDEFRSIR